MITSQRFRKLGDQLRRRLIDFVVIGNVLSFSMQEAQSQIRGHHPKQALLPAARPQAGDCDRRGFRRLVNTVLLHCFSPHPLVFPGFCEEPNRVCHCSSRGIERELYLPLGDNQTLPPGRTCPTRPTCSMLMLLLSVRWRVSAVVFAVTTMGFSFFER